MNQFDEDINPLIQKSAKLKKQELDTKYKNVRDEIDEKFEKKR